MGRTEWDKDTIVTKESTGEENDQSEDDDDDENDNDSNNNGNENQQEGSQVQEQPGSPSQVAYETEEMVVSVKIPQTPGDELEKAKITSPSPRDVNVSSLSNSDTATANSLEMPFLEGATPETVNQVSPQQNCKKKKSKQKLQKETMTSSPSGLDFAMPPRNQSLPDTVCHDMQAVPSDVVSSDDTPYSCNVSNGIAYQSRVSGFTCGPPSQDEVMKESEQPEQDVLYKTSQHSGFVVMPSYPCSSGSDLVKNQIRDRSTSPQLPSQKSANERCHISQDASEERVTLSDTNSGSFSRDNASAYSHEAEGEGDLVRMFEKCSTASSVDLPQAVRNSPQTQNRPTHHFAYPPVTNAPWEMDMSQGTDLASDTASPISQTQNRLNNTNGGRPNTGPFPDGAHTSRLHGVPSQRAAFTNSPSSETIALPIRHIQTSHDNAPNSVNQQNDEPLNQETSKSDQAQNGPDQVNQAQGSISSKKKKKNKKKRKKAKEANSKEENVSGAHQETDRDGDSSNHMGQPKTQTSTNMAYHGSQNQATGVTPVLGNSGQSHPKPNFAYQGVNQVEPPCYTTNTAAWGISSWYQEQMQVISREMQQQVQGTLQGLIRFIDDRSTQLRQSTALGQTGTEQGQENLIQLQNIRSSIINYLTRLSESLPGDLLRVGENFRNNMENRLGRMRFPTQAARTFSNPNDFARCRTAGRSTNDQTASQNAESEQIKRCTCRFPSQGRAASTASEATTTDKDWKIPTPSNVLIIPTHCMRLLEPPEVRRPLQTSARSSHSTQQSRSGNRHTLRSPNRPLLVHPFKETVEKTRWTFNFPVNELVDRFYAFFEDHPPTTPDQQYQKRQLRFRLFTWLRYENQRVYLAYYLKRVINQQQSFQASSSVIENGSRESKPPPNDDIDSQSHSHNLYRNSSSQNQRGSDTGSEELPSNEGNVNLPKCPSLDEAPHENIRASPRQTMHQSRPRASLTRQVPENLDTIIQDLMGTLDLTSGPHYHYARTVNNMNLYRLTSIQIMYLYRDGCYPENDGLLWWERLPPGPAPHLPPRLPGRYIFPGLTSDDDTDTLSTSCISDASNVGNLPNHIVDINYVNPHLQRQQPHYHRQQQAAPSFFDSPSTSNHLRSQAGGGQLRSGVMRPPIPPQTTSSVGYGHNLSPHELAYIQSIYQRDAPYQSLSSPLGVTDVQNSGINRTDGMTMQNTAGNPTFPMENTQGPGTNSSHIVNTQNSCMEQTQQGHQSHARYLSRFPIHAQQTLSSCIQYPPQVPSVPPPQNLISTLRNVPSDHNYAYASPYPQLPLLPQQQQEQQNSSAAASSSHSPGMQRSSTECPSMTIHGAHLPQQASGPHRNALHLTRQPASMQELGIHPHSHYLVSDRQMPTSNNVQSLPRAITDAGHDGEQIPSRLPTGSLGGIFPATERNVALTAGRIFPSTPRHSVSSGLPRPHATMLPPPPQVPVRGRFSLGRDRGPYRPLLHHPSGLSLASYRSPTMLRPELVRQEMERASLLQLAPGTRTEIGTDSSPMSNVPGAFGLPEMNRPSVLPGPRSPRVSEVDFSASQELSGTSDSAGRMGNPSLRTLATPEAFNERQLNQDVQWSRQDHRSPDAQQTADWSNERQHSETPSYYTEVTTLVRIVCSAFRDFLMNEQ